MSNESLESENGSGLSLCPQKPKGAELFSGSERFGPFSRLDLLSDVSRKLEKASVDVEALKKSVLMGMLRLEGWLGVDAPMDFEFNSSSLKADCIRQLF